MTSVDAETLVGPIQRFLDELERADVEAAIAAVEPICHPEMEFTSVITSSVDGRTYVGVEGLREWFQDYSDTFEVRYLDRQFTVHDEGVVVGLFTLVMLGRSSELELSREIGTVWELEDGLVVMAVSYGSQDEALKAGESARA